MAETKTLEREYVIPLRRHWLNVQQYNRTSKAVKAIKQFIAKHMKVADRDIDKVKLNVYFNNELWFRGRANPPAKVKVKARKEGDVVHVTFVETPQHVKFLQIKHARRHQKAEKKAPAPETKTETPSVSETKTEEAKVEEKEKEKAVAEQSLQESDNSAKAQKHITKFQKATHPQRMALKK